MSRLWAGWVALTSRTEAGTSIALVRVALGAIIVHIMLNAIWAGVVDVVWVDASFGGLRALGAGTPLVKALGGPTPQVVWSLVYANIALGTSVMVGFGGRWVIFLALQAFIGLVGLNMHAGGSYDELLSNGLWLLVLSSSTRTLSLDARLRTGRWVDLTPVMAWPRYLLIFQILLCYWTTGLQKLSAFWVPFGDLSALYYILQQPTWQLGDMRWVAWYFPLTQVATLITWLWEVSVPLWALAFYFRLNASDPGRLRALFNRWDVRSIYAVVGGVFHLIIAALMNVGPFGWVSLAYYPALYSPDEWRWVFRLVGWGDGQPQLSLDRPAGEQLREPLGRDI